MKRQGIWYLAGVYCAAGWVLGAQSTEAPAATTSAKKLSARELFYKPPTITTVALTNATQTVQKQTVKPTNRPNRVKPAEPPTTSEATTTAARQDPPVHTQRVNDTTPSRTPTASPVTEAVVPLGLRYSLLKRSSEGKFDEVDPGTVFHSGDRLRVRVEANDTGYLYILHRGSSNTWGVMFPNPDVAAGDNRVERGKVYEMPSGANLLFDDQVGTERLFVILSRKPEPDLEKLIYNLTNSGKSTPVQAPAVAKDTPKLLAASRESVDDSVISRYRKANMMVSRDLIFEKVDDTAGADNKERAVYVVNPVANDQARLIVDINVQHR